MAMIVAAHTYGEDEEGKQKDDGEETGKGQRVLAVLSVGVSGIDL